MRLKFVVMLALVLLAISITEQAMAGITTETIEYSYGETTLEGLLVYDDNQSGQRPGVVVVHQWMGITDYEIRRAEMLAELGYAAFVADMYGKGVRPADRTAAGAQAGAVRGDIELMRGRINAAVDTLRSQGMVERSRIAAIGYCFGGGVVLELARSGADVAGVVSFHGSLNTPDPADAANIRSKLLVCHGADDPHVNDEVVKAFLDEMRAAGVDYQFIAYANSVHAFTQPMAGNDNSSGAAYNELADKRSWRAMRDFFAEIFD